MGDSSAAYWAFLLNTRPNDDQILLLEQVALEHARDGRAASPGPLVHDCHETHRAPKLGLASPRTCHLLVMVEGRRDAERRPPDSPDRG